MLIFLCFAIISIIALKLWMNKRLKRSAIVILHAFAGWIVCAAIMGAGPMIFSMFTTLIIHLIGGPLFFVLVSAFYFKRFNYTTPVQTALIFISFVIVVDFFLVAMIILKSYEMFKSPMGTWIPFALIFLSTLITGLLVNKKTK